MNSPRMGSFLVSWKDTNCGRHAVPACVASHHRHNERAPNEINSKQHNSFEPGIGW